MTQPPPPPPVTAPANDSAVQSLGPAAPALVVMGVSGCGKSSLGAALAQALGWALVEGDDFHPAANRQKMAAGQALTDTDRIGWLDTLAAQLSAQRAAHPQGVVLTCSALKRAYRDRLRQGLDGLRFVFLDISEADAQQRVAARADHFFSPTLVASQFEALQPPHGEPGVLALPATQALHRLREQAIAWLQPAPPATAARQSSVTSPATPAANPQETAP